MVMNHNSDEYTIDQYIIWAARRLRNGTDECAYDMIFGCFGSVSSLVFFFVVFLVSRVGYEWKLDKKKLFDSVFRLFYLLFAVSSEHLRVWVCMGVSEYEWMCVNKKRIPRAESSYGIYDIDIFHGCGVDMYVVVCVRVE